jgi:hypothetical protein
MLRAKFDRKLTVTLHVGPYLTALLYREDTDCCAATSTFIAFAASKTVPRSLGADQLGSSRQTGHHEHAKFLREGV